MSSEYKPKNRDILLVDIAFEDKRTGELIEKGKRPCVVVRDNEPDQLRLRTITSQIDKYPADPYGVHISKNDQNGLDKNSAILCTKDNSFAVKKDATKQFKKIGEISKDQLLETLERSAACNRKDIQLRYSVRLRKQHRM